MIHSKPAHPVKASFVGRTQIRLEYVFDDLEKWLEVWDKRLFSAGVVVAFLGLAFELHVDSGPTVFSYLGHFILASILHVAHAVASKEKSISLDVSLAGGGLVTVSIMARLVRWRNNRGSARKPNA